MNEEIGLEDFRLSLIELWKKKFLIIAAALLCFLIGLLVTFNMNVPSTYVARATVYSAFYGSYEESVDAAVAMVNYSEVLTSNKVCERAASIIGDANITATDIKSMISGGTSTSSIVMGINAISDNPQVAMVVANAVAESFVIEIRTVTGSEAIQVLDEAKTAMIANNGSNTVWKIRILAFIVGGGLSTVFIFFKELFSDKIKSMKQVENYEENVLGIIPTISNNEKGA